jgi:hypothetical protein
MIWATYWEPRSSITFWAHVNRGLVLALAGSAYHVLGEQREGHAASASLTSAIAHWIHSNIEEPFPKDAYEYAQKTTTYLDGEESKLSDYDIANGVWLAARFAKGQSSRFEFVAKVLHQSKWPDGFRDGKSKRIVLASPLYVSLSR